MAIRYDTLHKRTVRLAQILDAWGNLGDGLPVRPEVSVGLRTAGAAQCAIHVFRQEMDDYEWWMGTEGEDLEGTWGIACVVRHAGDPEALEREMSYLIANVVRCLRGYKQDSGYWQVLTLGRHRALNVRSESNQVYEVEVIPVTLQWQETGD